MRNITIRNRYSRLAWLAAVAACTGGFAVLGPPDARVQAQGWNRVYAADNSFVVDVPADWAVTDKRLSSFSAQSRSSGDRVGVLATEILADQQSFANASTACRQGGIGCEFQFWSPPLTPVDVVRVLYPKTSGGRVQGVRILGARGASASGVQAQGGEVHYTFLDQGVQMEADGLIYTFPVTSTPQVRYWSLLGVTAGGPPQVFRRNIPTYVRILQSLHYDQSTLNTVAQGPLNFAPREFADMLRNLQR